jgi:hypothetical protein
MMQPIRQTMLLLASREEMHRVWGRFDHERPGISINQILFFVVAFTIAVVAVVIWRILKRRTGRTFTSDSSVKLFRELCAAHGIKRPGRRLLKKLAEARGVTNPATLFIEPAFFDLQTLPRALRASEAELRALDETLFG